jgi:hypothetical protein
MSDKLLKITNTTHLVGQPKLVSLSGDLGTPKIKLEKYQTVYVNLYDVQFDIQFISELTKFVNLGRVKVYSEGIELSEIEINQLAYSGAAPDDDFHIELSLEVATANDDEILIWDTSDGNYKRQLKSDFIAGSGGESNTASNVGVGGVGLYLQKVGVDLEFKNINIGSSKLTILNDLVNKEVVLDVDESNLSLSNLGEKNYSSLVGRPGDDDFHTLPSLLSVEDSDEVLVWDSSEASYKRMVRSVFLSGVSVDSSSSRTMYVDGGKSVTSPDGSFLKPYTTIQSALDAIGSPTSIAEAEQQWTVYIESGYYDENLTIPAGRIIQLLCKGPVVLGNGPSPSILRNLTYIVDSTKEFGGIRPVLTIKCLAIGESTSTHIARSGAFFISGDFRRTSTGGTASTHDVVLYGVKIGGRYTSIDSGFALGQNSLYLYYCYIAGAVSIEMGPTSSNIYLQRAIECEFDGTISVTSLGKIIGCEFDGNVTVTSVPSSDLPPPGYFRNDWGSKIFTGPAGSFLIDSTNVSLPTLAGGATISYISKASMVGNDSFIPGASVKDALNYLNGYVPVSGAGNPNGIIIGNLGQAYYDTANSMWYKCVLNGSSIWRLV